MKDLDGLIDTVKKNAKAAESGDEAAQQLLRNELFRCREPTALW